MQREFDAWTYGDEVEDAYWQRWHMLVEQQAEQPESCYVPDAYEDNPEVYNFDGWLPWSREQELNQRIEDSLPPQSGYKPFSNKRWATNRKARYVRRDGSPRGHWCDGVSHKDVMLLERAARTGMKRLLRNIRDGVVDPDAVHLTAQSSTLDEELMNA